MSFISNMSNSTTETTINDTASSFDFPYEEGEEIRQIWNPTFVVFAYLIACVSSYSAVHVLDHGLWRCPELRKAAIIKHPDVVAAFLLSFGTVWGMHFVSTINRAESVMFKTTTIPHVFLTVSYSLSTDSYTLGGNVGCYT